MDEQKNNSIIDRGERIRNIYKEEKKLSEGFTQGKYPLNIWDLFRRADGLKPSGTVCFLSVSTTEATLLHSCIGLITPRSMHAGIVWSNLARIPRTHVWNAGFGWWLWG